MPSLFEDPDRREISKESNRDEENQFDPGPLLEDQEEDPNLVSPLSLFASMPGLNVLHLTNPS